MKFAGSVLRGLGQGIRDVASPYALPVINMFQGRPVEGLGAAAGLGIGGLATAGLGYLAGAQHTFDRYKEPTLHDQLLYKVQMENPDLTANQAQYEAAKMYADIANKPDEWVDSYMMDIGADQGDSWLHMKPNPMSRYGREGHYRTDQQPTTETGFVYLGDGQWEPGSPWDSNNSSRNYGMY